MVKPLKSTRNLREAKKAVCKAYSKEYDDLYQNLGTREEEKETYKQQKMRDLKVELNQIKRLKR